MRRASADQFQNIASMSGRNNITINLGHCLQSRNFFLQRTRNLFLLSNIFSDPIEV